MAADGAELAQHLEGERAGRLAGEDADDVVGALAALALGAVVGVIPVQFILALPYALTVLLLAGFVGTAVAPKAIGVPYSKEK